MLNILSNLVPLLSSGFDYNYNYSTSSDVDGAVGGLILFIYCCAFIFAIIVYVITAYAQMNMAANLGLEDKKIFAWIPILNIYLLALMADKDIMWFVIALIFSPVTFLFYYEIFTKKYGKESSYFLMFLVAALVFFPVALYMLWSLSKEKPVEMAKPAASM